MHIALINRKNLIILNLSILFTLISFFAFESTGRDDSYITYWIAKSISEGSFNGYNDYPYEQTSSILFSAVIGFISKIFNIPIIVSAKVFELFCSIVLNIINLQIFYSKRIFGIIASFSLSILPIFAYWSWSGMEVSANVLIILISCLLLEKFIIKQTFFCFITLIITNTLYVFLRPESIIALPLSLILINYFLIKEIFVRKNLTYKVISKKLFIAFIFPIVLGSISRLIIFGKFLPATVYAKSLWETNIFERFIKGIIYLFSFGLIGNNFNLYFILFFGSIFIFLFLGCFISAMKSQKILPKITFLIGLSQCFVVIVSGGDWMEMGRFMVSSGYLFLFSILYSFMDFKNFKKLVLILTIPSLLFHIIASNKIFKATYYLMTNISYFPILQKDNYLMYKRFNILGHDFSNKYINCNPRLELSNYVHLRDCIFIDKILEEKIVYKNIEFKQGDIIMSKQAGLVFYYLKTKYPFLKFIDPLGLASSEILDNPIFANYNESILTNQKLFEKFIQEYKPKYIFDINKERLSDMLDNKKYRIIVFVKFDDIYTNRVFEQVLYERIE